MLITKELIMTLLIVFGIGKYSESKSPKYYDIVTEEGKTINIMVHKNSKNPCPTHCEADHYHRTVISNDRITYDNIFYTLSGFNSNDLIINSYEVVDVIKIEINKRMGYESDSSEDKEEKILLKEEERKRKIENVKKEEEELNKPKFMNLLES